MATKQLWPAFSINEVESSPKPNANCATKMSHMICHFFHPVRGNTITMAFSREIRTTLLATFLDNSRSPEAPHQSINRHGTRLIASSTLDKTAALSDTPAPYPPHNYSTENRTEERKQTHTMELDSKLYTVVPAI